MNKMFMFCEAVWLWRVPSYLLKCVTQCIHLQGWRAHFSSRLFFSDSFSAMKMEARVFVDDDTQKTTTLICIVMYCLPWTWNQLTDIVAHVGGSHRGNTLFNFYHATKDHIPEDSTLRGFYVMFQVTYVYIKRITFYEPMK